MSEMPNFGGGPPQKQKDRRASLAIIGVVVAIIVALIVWALVS